MDLKSFKLRLVRAILQCEDPELLEAVQQILNLDRSPPAISPGDLPDDARELQQSLDELFGDPGKSH
jgi:hypothetical protein